MQVRTSGWILVASGVAITALFACSEGQWAKEPLPTCDEGDDGCGSGKSQNNNKGGSKGKAPSGTPTPAETQSTTEEENNDPPGNATTTPDASTTPPKDAGGNTTPPTKGPNCLSNQNTCIAVTLKCGCAEDCCAGTVCAQVGGLVQNTCCKITASPCTSHSECCGQLLCKANASGTGMSCQ